MQHPTACTAAVIIMTHFWPPTVPWHWYAQPCTIHGDHSVFSLTSCRCRCWRLYFSL